MEANSTQGLSVLLFLVAFAFLSWGLFAEGNLVLLLLFVVSFAASVVTFMKVKTGQIER